MAPYYRRIVVNLLISELSLRSPDEIQLSIHVLKSSVEVVMRLDLFPKPTLVEKSLEEVDQTPSSRVSNESESNGAFLLVKTSRTFSEISFMTLDFIENSRHEHLSLKVHNVNFF